MILLHLSYLEFEGNLLENQGNSTIMHLIRLSVLIAWFVSFLLSIVILSFIFALVLLFYLVGQSVRIGLLQPLFKKHGSPSPLEFFILDIFFSLIITSSLVAILSYFHFLYVISIMCPVFFLVIFPPLISLTIGKIEHEMEIHNLENQKELMASLAIILLVGLVIILFQLTRFPYPKSPGTDSFSHLAAINSIIYSHGTNNILGNYSYIYHSIIASFTLLSGGDAIWCNNALISFTYPYSLVITFFFLVSITKNTFLSLLATIGTLAVFEHGGLLATYYPYPSSFAYIFIFTIYTSSIIFRGEKKALVALLLAYCIAVVLYIALLIVSAPILVYLLEKGNYLPSKMKGISRAIFALAIIGATLLIILVYIIFPLSGYPDFEYNLMRIAIKNTIDVAIYKFTLSYSIGQIIAMACGILILISLVFHSNQRVIKRLEELDSELILLVTVSYLLFFFAPLEFAYRTEEFIRPLFVLLMIIAAYSVFSIIEFIRPDSEFYEIRIFKTNKKVKAAVLLTIIVLIPINYGQVNAEIDYLLSRQHVMPENSEMDIFRWIENHTEIGDYILKKALGLS
ncbi:MAG: hypothetical protein ACFFEV_03460 [Candidatus Thorarchaeota archaeon]